MLPVVMFKKKKHIKERKKNKKKTQKKEKERINKMPLHISTNALYIGIYACLSVTKTKMKHLLTFK